MKMYLGHRCYLGQYGAWHYINKSGKKIYLTNQMKLIYDVKPRQKKLITHIPSCIEDIIMDYKNQLETSDRNIYLFMLSLTILQRHNLIKMCRKNGIFQMFDTSIDLAIEFFPESSKIHQKAVKYLHNY